MKNKKTRRTRAPRVILRRIVIPQSNWLFQNDLPEVLRSAEPWSSLLTVQSRYMFHTQYGNSNDDAEFLYSTLAMDVTRFKVCFLLDFIAGTVTTDTRRDAPRHYDRELNMN